MSAGFIDQALLSAGASGNLEVVKDLLEKKASVCYEDEFGQTALMRAVLSNHLEVSELLLKKGSDPNNKDHTGLSPFIAAGANGFADLLKLMTTYGAVESSVNRFGGTALLPSSEKGYTKTVQYCLEFGVPVNHANNLGWTALHEAVILGDGGHLYELVVQLLLESRADFHMKDRQGLSSYEYAQILGQSRISNLFEGKSPHSNVLSLKLFALYKKENYDEGLKIIETSISAGESKKILFFWKGLFLQEEKKYSSAIAAYWAGIENESEDRQFYFYIANCFRLIHKPEEALRTFNKAITENPEPSFFLYHKSNYLRELGRHHEAINVMDKLLEKWPKRPDYLFHKANSLRAIEEHSKAVQTMDLAIALDSTNELFTEHRGCSIELLNKIKQIQ